MKMEDRLSALAWLGRNIWELDGLKQTIETAGRINPFFTEEFCRLSLGNIQTWLKPDILLIWTKPFPETTKARTTGLIMAGNLPLVGWHDVISIFAAGHICRYKPSSQDSILPEFLINSLVKQYPAAASYFQKSDSMKEVEAIIATGSNATAAHFDYYFRHIPRLIRGSRSSLGFIYGFETVSELAPLCDDIMQYFGMGCRSITKLLVPSGYDFHDFFTALEKYRYLTEHHRFQNNAIYHKAIFLMNGDPFLENDILILRENPNLFSPPGVLHFQYYSDMKEAGTIIAAHGKDLQCFVSHLGEFPSSLAFGKAQQPEITDYADGKDTLKFLFNAFGEDY